MKFKVTITKTQEKVKVVKARDLDSAIAAAQAGGGKTISRSQPSKSFRAVYDNLFEDPSLSSQSLHP